MVLSSLTGEKASTIQDREKQVTENIQEQARIAREDVKIKELQQIGTPEADEEIKKIEKNREDRQRLMRAFAAERGVATGEQIGTIFEIDGYARGMEGAVLTDLRGAKNTFERTGSTDAALKENGERILENINRLGRAAEYDKQALETFINTTDPAELNRIMRTRGLNKDQIKAALAAKGAEGVDPLADASASLQELEIAANQQFQSFLESIDPFRHGLKLFKDAAIAAAAVLGGGALLAGLAKVIGGRFGELGSARNPMYAKLDSGPGVPSGPDNSSKGKGIGAKLKGLFSKTAAPAAAAAGATSAAGPLAAGATGASSLSSAAGSAGGSKVGMFLIGLSKGLSALGKAAPQVLLGAGAISGAIAIIGAGIAGATWLVGKSLPSLASGLTAFDTIDGDKLSKIGTGMAGMAAGLLAFGGSKITDAMGSFAAWASGDDSNPIDKLQTHLTKFQKLKVEPNKVERNSKAFIAFNKMLAESTEISGTVAGALSRAFGSFFEVDIPLDKFKTFSDLEINAEQAGKNATAFKLFSEAMATYQGVESIGTLGIIANALGKSVFEFYQSLPSDDPIKRFEKFSKISIDGAKAKINAGAFKDFANAMAEYKGGPSVIEALSQLVGRGMMALFDVGGPIDSFKKFSQEDFGPNMEKNTEALAKYANSGGKGSGASSGGDAAPAAPAASSAPAAPAPAAPSGGDTAPSGGTASTPTTSAEPAGAAPAGPAPSLGASKDEIMAYAKPLSPAARSEFYRSLASQSMQKVAAARAAGNSAQATFYEQAAGQFQLASSIAASSGQSGNNNTSNNTSRADIVSIGKDLQQRGLRIAEHPAFGGVAPVHKGRGHYEGRAIDINAIAGRDVDNPRAAATLDNLKAELEGKGLKVLWRTAGHYNHMHAEVPRAKAAAYGGIFSDSPAMVGSGMAEAQKIGMLNPQSLISKLGKTAALEVPNITNPVTTEIETDLTPELLSMIEGKLAKVLYALENNQDTHERILKNSM
jgi:hypothetical protein